MSFRFHPQARDDLLAIYDYVAEKNESAAESLIGRLYEACLFLDGAPWAGRARPDLAEGLRSFPVGRYLLLYRVADRDIEIIHVAHGARDLRVVVEKDGR